MIEMYKGMNVDEIKARLSTLSNDELQNIIKEGNNQYQQLNQKKAQIEAEIKVNQDAYNAEMTKLKDFGINSIEELNQAILTEKEQLTSNLSKLVEIINGVE